MFNANHSGVYIPPHLNANNPSASSRDLPSSETRYSKDQLLDIYQNLKESSTLDRSLGDIFLGTWDPRDSKNGTASMGGRGDLKDQAPGPEVCWNYNVNLEPFGLTNMSEEEKQVRQVVLMCNMDPADLEGSSSLLRSIHHSSCRTTQRRRLVWA
jgi:PERQ amino acid-rich with GYF domain-containing protein